jgi:hypothetical protein
MVIHTQCHYNTALRHVGLARRRPNKSSRASSLHNREPSSSTSRNPGNRTAGFILHDSRTCRWPAQPISATASSSFISQWPFNKFTDALTNHGISAVTTNYCTAYCQTVMNICVYVGTVIVTAQNTPQYRTHMTTSGLYLDSETSGCLGCF